MDLAPCLRRIRLLAMDVDGVLTDGRLIYDAEGRELKAFHIRDGLGIRLAQAGGLTVAFITARKSRMVADRARELGVEEVHQQVADKADKLREIAQRRGLAMAEVAYLGDDLNDLRAVQAAGCGIAVADAAPELRALADHVTAAPGGYGAVREVVTAILQAQGTYEQVVRERYGPCFLSEERGEVAASDRICYNGNGSCNADSAAATRSTKTTMSQPTQGFKLFAGTSNPKLAQEISEYLGVPLGKIRIERFSDGEIYVAAQENVRGTEVFIIQSTCPPVNDHIMELAIMIDSFKRASAERITAVVPYYGYARQEKKDAPREPIAARLVADILEAAGADRVVTVDLHAGAIQGFFNIPTDHLTALPRFAQHFLREDIKNLTVVAPDAGRVKSAEKLADVLNAPLTVVYKHRPRHQIAEATHVVGDLKDRTPVIFEDIVATGGTLVECVEALLEHGARPEIHIAVTHPLFTGDAVQRLDRPEIAEIVVTNTIPLPPEKQIPRIKQLSLAKLLGEAIRRIHHNESVSVLFQPLAIENEL